MTRTPITIDRLPLFADDEQIGEAVLGRDRKREFATIAASLEPVGLPRMNALMGGRYVPAVRAFMERHHGLADVDPAKPKGVKGKWRRDP